MARTLVRHLFAALAVSAVSIAAHAQSLIRDAEIESTMREWTDPILEEAEHKH